MAGARLQRAGWGVGGLQEEGLLHSGQRVPRVGLMDPVSSPWPLSPGKAKILGFCHCFHIAFTGLRTSAAVHLLKCQRSGLGTGRPVFVSGSVSKSPWRPIHCPTACSHFSRDPLSS